MLRQAINMAKHVMRNCASFTVRFNRDSIKCHALANPQEPGGLPSAERHLSYKSEASQLLALSSLSSAGLTTGAPVGASVGSTLGSSAALPANLSGNLAVSLPIRASEQSANSSQLSANSSIATTITTTTTTLATSLTAVPHLSLAASSAFDTSATSLVSATLAVSAISELASSAVSASFVSSSVLSPAKSLEPEGDALVPAAGVGVHHEQSVDKLSADKLAAKSTGAVCLLSELKAQDEFSSWRGLRLFGGLSLSRIGLSRGNRVGLTLGLGRWGRYVVRALGLGVISGLLMFNSGCSSSEDLPEQAVLVTDPINFKVNGLSGDADTNVKAHLNSMAVISKKRVRFYRREIRDTTAKALHAYGYYHPTIKVTLPDENDPKDFTVVVDVDAGKPLYIRNCVIEILGEGSNYKVFNEILKSSTLASYQILNHGLYEQVKNDLQKQAFSLGFFDGKFISSRILVYQDQNMADIELIYDTGKRYALGSVLADAETQRLLKPVAPLKKFKDGDPFSTKVLNSYVNSLNQTGYFRSVDVRPVIENAQDFQVPVEVHLERRPNNVMRLGVGFSTDEGPRGLIEWDKPLLNERGDSFSSMAKISTVTQNAQMIYKIPRKNPNLDFYTINASQIHTDLNDTVSDLSHLSFHYIANQTGRWRRDYFVKAEYENYEQASEDGSTTNIMPGIRITRRESSGGFDPSLGYNFTIETFGAHEAWSDLSFLQTNASYTGMFAPTDHTRFLFRVSQGVNFGPHSNVLPPSMRYFAGGDNSVRGFGYKAIAPKQDDGSGLKGGRFMTTGSIEFQFPIGIANSRAAVFLDAGLVTDDYATNTEDDLILGPGVGYRFMSPYGAVRVDFAVGIQHDEERNYRIHFAFGPEF